jgi:MFS superfamily sulfate permease-like transporter
VQYLPNFFFGALLVVFGIEIAGDWLVRSYAKVTRAEYVLLLATFVAIMELELEKGVAAGILMCTIYFAVTYARVSAHNAAVRACHSVVVLCLPGEWFACRVSDVILLQANMAAFRVLPSRLSNVVTLCRNHLVAGQHGSVQGAAVPLCCGALLHGEPRAGGT